MAKLALLLVETVKNENRTYKQRQVYNSPNICTLVINGKAVDCYVGLVSTSFCLTGKVKTFEKDVLVEAKMGYLYMKLYCDGNLVAKVFMGF